MTSIIETFQFGQRAVRARTFKLFINKATFRAFYITIGLFLLLLLLYWGYNTIQEKQLALRKNIPIAKLKLSDLPPPPSNSDVPPPPPPPSQVSMAAGPAARAGTPVPVPDAQLDPNLKDFANTDDLSRASAIGGDGTDVGGFDNIGDGNISVDNDVKVNTREEIPDPDEFVAVEKEPNVDLGQLQKNVEYPEMAKRAGVEGKVSIRVLVSKTGKPKKTIIESSDSDLLNDAATKAVMKTTFTPAIQNGSPIDCWVSIPIVFRLR